MRLVLQTFAVPCDRLVRYAGARSHGRSAGAPPPLSRPVQTPPASRPCRAISTGTRGARARRAVKRRFFSVRHGRKSRCSERYISSASPITPASVRCPPGRLFVLTPVPCPRLVSPVLSLQPCVPSPSLSLSPLARSRLLSRAMSPRGTVCRRSRPALSRARLRSRSTVRAPAAFPP
jgi:hypothetical protein